MLFIRRVDDLSMTVREGEEKREGKHWESNRQPWRGEPSREGMRNPNELRRGGGRIYLEKERLTEPRLLLVREENRERRWSGREGESSCYAY